MWVDKGKRSVDKTHNNEPLSWPSTLLIISEVPEWLCLLLLLLLLIDFVIVLVVVLKENEAVEVWIIDIV